jgi:hypothetical protein
LGVEGGIMNKKILSIGIILTLLTMLLCGCQQEKYTTEAEDPEVLVRAELGKIKITLITGGVNMPSTGYSFLHSVIIRLNGTILDDTIGFSDEFWEVGKSIYLGNSTPKLDDSPIDVGPLGAADYLITVEVRQTLIYDNIVTIV